MPVAELNVTLGAVGLDRAGTYFTGGLGIGTRFTSQYRTGLELGPLVLALGGNADHIDSIPGWSGTRADDVGIGIEYVVDSDGRAIDGPNDRSDQGIVLAEVADPEGNVTMLSGQLS